MMGGVKKNIQGKPAKESELHFFVWMLNGQMEKQCSYFKFVPVNALLVEEGL